jgi:chromosome segregation ATPase
MIHAYIYLLLNFQFAIYSDAVINDMQRQIQAQQTALQEIEQRINGHMKDISMYSNELKTIDSSIPAIEESVDRAWRIIGTNAKLEKCHQQCTLLVRRLRAINIAMDRREEKLSRYRNWLKGMKVRIDVMTIAGRDTDMWKQRWKYISSKLILAITWW